MSIKIQIPTPLRRFTSEAGEVEVEGATVGQAMRALTAKHPALERHIYSDDGGLRSFVNLFLNDEDVRHIGREGAAVKPGDTISIIPSIAGGGR